MKIQFLPHREQTTFPLQGPIFFIFTALIVHYGKTQKEHTNSLCWQNTQFLKVKADSTVSLQMWFERWNVSNERTCRSFSFLWTINPSEIQTVPKRGIYTCWIITSYDPAAVTLSPLSRAERILTACRDVKAAGKRCHPHQRVDYASSPWNRQRMKLLSCLG